MSDQTPETQDTPPEALPNGEINPSRRRLAGAALGVSVIFTLASRPVLAADQCMSPSGAVSGNLSQHGTPTLCTGRSPGYWKNKGQSWPSPYLPGSCSAGNGCNKPENWTSGTLFHPLFSGTRFIADLDGNPGTPKASLSLIDRPGQFRGAYRGGTVECQDGVNPDPVGNGRNRHLERMGGQGIFRAHCRRTLEFGADRGLSQDHHAQLI